MDEHNINQTLKQFWDTQFQKLDEPIMIKKIDFKPKNPLDEALIYLGNHAKRIVDVGAGSGEMLLTAIINGKKADYGLALEPSKHACEFLKQSLKQSHIKNIETMVGDHTYLKSIDTLFDGIICSNVLDVVPQKTSLEIISTINDSLKPGGLLLIKLNFYLTKNLIKKLNMTPLGDNMYAMNDVLRGLNYDTATWVKRFKGYEVISQADYERLKDGPKDRIILLRKPN